MTYVNRCHVCGSRFEWLAPRFTTPDPMCPDCGAPTTRCVTAPAIVWTKRLVDYGDPKKETARKDQRNGGHWTFERDSDRAKEAGRPIPRFIDSVQAQRDYCKAEKLIMPSDLPSNLNVTKDGQGFQTANRSEV